VRAAFLALTPDAASAFIAKDNGKWLADLYRLAELRLHALGVERVFGGGFCTFSETQRFYSYRREKETGRMASLIWLE
jgi:polyphenol oxidase